MNKSDGKFEKASFIAVTADCRGAIVRKSLQPVPLMVIQHKASEKITVRAFTLTRPLVFVNVFYLFNVKVS